MLHISHQPPTFTEQDAAHFAHTMYGLRASARALPGEYDQNFYLKTVNGQAFVLKIAHAAEERDVLDLQNTALEYLATQAPELVLPRVCTTLDGTSIATVAGAEDSKHFIRLLSYVPGRVLAKVNPHTPALLYELGKMLGTLDRALLDFAHPAAQRALKWDLARAGWIRDYIQYIERPQQRSMVEQLLARFESDIRPVLPELRASIIHNDANDYNVLVGESEAGKGPVISVADFGDMLYSCTVCELAIAATYAIMRKADPLATAARIVAGYHEALPLSEQELEVLFPLICMRLCVSVTNSAYRQRIRPDDAYVTISEQPAWALLERLMQINPRFAYYTFREACGLSPCPKTEKVVNWLAKHTEDIGPVIEADLRTENVVVFDLSVGSSELGNLAELDDTGAFTHKLFGRLKGAKTRVGVGRYNEARPIYTSELFRSEGNDGPEWRTVHIGLDLFMEAGSPVYAPLDGTVHSFCNNAASQDYGPTIILEHRVDNVTFYTLYGHLSEDSLDGLYEGMEVARGTMLGRIGNYPINGGWPPHLHLQIISDMLDKQGEFPGVARPSQRATWLSLSPDPNVLVGIPAEKLPAKRLSGEQILALREQHIGKSLSISYRAPLTIVRGAMQYLYDEDGRRYLDCVNNVCHVGHCHPRVVKAGQEQMAVLNTNTRYLHENLGRYAERLCATLPEPLRVCFFVCSGSEANELALRMARTHTRRKDVIVVDVAYHGNTTTLVEISPYKAEGPGGAGLPDYVHKVPMPDVYRGQHRRDDAQAGEKYARYVEDVIQSNQGKVGAFICESLLGCGGQIVLPDNYLKTAYRYMREAGGVCIADEVQTGFGRVGTHFWGFETQGVVPDIVTMGKPMGNGHPLAAVVTTPEIAASFNNGMEYFNTFGGNPVSCAIGLAVLDVIADEGLQEHALNVGEHLMRGLRGLMGKHALIGDVRGLGLFIGVELVLDRETLEPATRQAAYVINRMRECGILLSTDGPLHNVLKIKPPLVFSEKDADRLVSLLDKIVEEDGAKG